MLLTTLAAAPETDPDTLTWLAEHALRAEDRDGQALRIALASNPAVPVAVVRDLADVSEDGDWLGTFSDAARERIVQAAMARPAITGADIAAILGARAASPAMSKAALRAARLAPDGHLAVDHIARTANDETTYVRMLQHPQATRATQLAAIAGVNASASSSNVHPQVWEALDVLCATASASEAPQIAAWARQVRTTDGVLCDGNGATSLTRALERLGQQPVPGTATWYSHPQTSIDDILTRAFSSAPHLGIEGLNFALAYHPDREQLARAVVDAPALYDATLPAIMAATRSQETHDRALLRFARGRDFSPAIAGRVLRATTATLVELAVAAPRDETYFRRACARADLTPEHLDALHTTLEHRTVLAATSSPAHFGLVMATHPNATLTQRAAGRELARNGAAVHNGLLSSHPGRRGMRLGHRARNEVYELLAMAEPTLGLDPGADPTSPATIGARLPQRTLPGEDAVPGLAWLRRAAAASLVTLDDVADATTRNAIRALEPTFPGTLAELLATARTIAQ